MKTKLFGIIALICMAPALIAAEGDSGVRGKSPPEESWLPFGHMSWLNTPRSTPPVAQSNDWTPAGHRPWQNLQHLKGQTQPPVAKTGKPTKGSWRTSGHTNWQGIQSRRAGEDVQEAEAWVPRGHGSWQNIPTAAGR